MSKRICLDMTDGLSDKKNIVFNAFGSLVYLGCQWLLTVIVVRLTDNLSYAGDLALAMSIANIFVPFAQYRIRTFQISDVTHEYATGEYLGFRLFTISISLIGIMIYSFFTCDSDSLLCVFLFLLYKSVELVIDVFHGLDQQNYRMDYVGISFAIRGVLSVLSFSIALLLDLGLEIAILAMTVSTLPVCLFFDRSKASQFDSLRVIFNYSKYKQLLVMCFLPAASLFACSIAMTFPRQLLDGEWGSAYLGIYASVASPVAIIQAGASYIYTPLLGRFAQAYHDGDSLLFRSLFIKVMAAMALCIAVMCILFQLFGYPLLFIFYGENVAHHTELLLPMILCSMCTVMLWFANDLLVVMRKIRQSFVGNGIACGLAIASAFYLVDAFGMNGVSYTGIIGYGLAFIVSLCFVFSKATFVKAAK